MREQITYLDNQVELIQWLTHVTKQDINLNAGNILERLSDLETIYDKLKIDSRSEINKLKQTLAKTEKERDEMFAQLKRMSEKIVPPLVQQVALREKENMELKAQNKQIQYGLKMLHAVIRSPKLSDLYAKEERKHMTAQQITQANKEAFKKLRQNTVSEKNAKKFIVDLSSSVNQSLKIRYNSMQEQARKASYTASDNSGGAINA